MTKKQINTAADNQNIFDYCLQMYGTIDNLIEDLLKDNDLTFSSKIVSGQQFIINLNKGDENVKNYIKINNFVISNKMLASDTSISSTNWILDTGFWVDTASWIDTKVWID